jgi:hypothetical protein
MGSCCVPRSTLISYRAMNLYNALTGLGYKGELAEVGTGRSSKQDFQNRQRPVRPRINAICMISHEHTRDAQINSIL